MGTGEERAFTGGIRDNLLKEGGEAKMNLAGRRILMVVAPKNFRDEEFLEPKGVFESRGAEVVITSRGVSEASGMLGAKVAVDKDVSEVSAGDFDAIVFVGGSGSSVYFDAPEAHKLAKEAAEYGRVLGAICIAPSILANAGVLDGKRATAFVSEEGNLKERGAVYIGEPVTVDGKIITAAGPQAARKFGEAIAEALE